MSSESLFRGCKVAVFLGAVVAVCSAGTAPPATTQKLRATGPAAPTPTAVQPSRYTESLNCPASGLTVQITPATIPAGWINFAELLNLRGASVENPPGRQVLWCDYRNSHPDTHISMRLTFVPAPDSCIVSPNKLGFLCKPGSLK